MTEALSAFFPDFGVAAVFGAESATVLRDEETQSVLDGMVLGEEVSITLPSASLPSLAAGSSGMVDGVAYTVREVRVIDDGKLKRATLRKA